MTRCAVLTAGLITLLFIFPFEINENPSVVLTSYAPKNDSDHSGEESIYNDPRLTISTENNGIKVASCKGCHFECKHCERE